MSENIISMQHIAVTGASGHLGNVICRTLIEQGISVSALQTTKHWKDWL